MPPSKPAMRAPRATVAPASKASFVRIHEHPGHFHPTGRHGLRRGAAPGPRPAFEGVVLKKELRRLLEGFHVRIGHVRDAALLVTFDVPDIDVAGQFRGDGFPDTGENLRRGLRPVTGRGPRRR